MDFKSLKSLIINKGMNLALFFMLNLALSVVFAVNASDQITGALCDMKDMMDAILPTMAFVLFVLAGVAYAAGNFFGAEMRAKAVGYAMNMITGAIISLLLSIIGPTIIDAFYTGASTSCD